MYKIILSKPIFLLLLILLPLSSCGRRQTRYVLMTTAEVLCPDQWRQGSTDEQTIRNISDTLSQNGIGHINTRFDGQSQTTCQACGCTTGRRILVEVDEDDIGRALILGFQRV
ncbi:MAG TPA: hypothetical protein DCM08_07815 [Microscillaceae bacterium]|jgi:hypothetical protein|nr:hypothetical protein [Microscillaceae bacterium]